MPAKNTNPAINNLLDDIRKGKIAILKDLEGVVDQFALTLTMQEIKGPTAEYAKRLMDDMLFVLDDLDQELLALLGPKFDDLKERSKALRQKVIKLFNENLAQAIK